MTRARTQRNKLQGSLVRGDFRVAMPYAGMSNEHTHVSGMVVSSVHSVTPATLTRFSKACEIIYSDPILYSFGVTCETSFLLNPHLWCWARILLWKEDPLLKRMGSLDGTVPAFFRDEDIEIVQKIDSPIP